MQSSLAYGQERLAIDIPDQRCVKVRQNPPGPTLLDPSAALRNALENPLDFPPLRQALTPDDHIAVVVDEHLPCVASLLVPLLEHLVQAGVRPDSVTLLCVPPSSGQPWLEELPDLYQDVRVEVHQPADRRKLSYLATTRAGRRVYLSRTAVDADQLIVLTQRRYDCLLGYGGGAGAVFPSLSDEDTLSNLAKYLSSEATSGATWPLYEEATEVCWLLGAPFLIQVIAGSDGGLQHILAGTVASGAKGQSLLDDTWHVEVDQPASLVLASVGGTGPHLGFADIAAAFLAASRIVTAGGQIAVVCDMDPILGRDAELLRQREDPVQAFQLLLHEKNLDPQAAFAWTSAAAKAKLFLFSRLPGIVAEELFVTPFERADEVKNLIASASSVAVLNDAHQTMAVVHPHA